MSEVYLSDWKECPAPKRFTLQGKYCRLEPFNIEKHAVGLYESAMQPGFEKRYYYLPGDVPHDFEDFKNCMNQKINAELDVYYAVIDLRTNKPSGRLSLRSIDTVNGAGEFGDVQWGAELQRTRAATEAFFLVSDYLFSLGYRRYVWRCNELNVPSQNAAKRFGYLYEGRFRQHMVLKGRNRNTLFFFNSRLGMARN